MLTPWLERRVGQLVFSHLLLRWFPGIHHHWCSWGTLLGQFIFEFLHSILQRLNFLNLNPGFHGYIVTIGGVVRSFVCLRCRAAGVEA